MNDRFDQPQDTTALDLAFGGNISDLLPSYESIPDEFKRGFNNRWCNIVNQWFFEGLPKGTEFIPQDGIDTTKALNHIKSILCSFQPKHEHKTAGVAWLLSRWFKDIKITKVT